MPSLPRSRWSLAASTLMGLSLACGGGDGIRDSNTFGDMGSDTGSSGSSETAADDDSCPIAAEGCPCTQGQSCDVGLVCDAGICVPEDPSGDGDGDPGQVCTEDHFIELLAVDASNLVGWDIVDSQIGEGMVLAWDEQTDDASARFNIPIPCDDFWHVWVRGHDVDTRDSYLVTLDGAPDQAPIFEVDCTNGPQNPTYLWRELNRREEGSMPCEYVEDPWVQDWTAGFHTMTLYYRESIAISKIWVTNTGMVPP